MKKVFYIIAVSLVVGSVFSSCKTHERCPAYGKKVESPVSTAKSV